MIASPFSSFRSPMIPVAIMTGDGDKVIDPKQADKLRRAIPHGTLQILHGIGHMIHHVATQEVVDAIEEVARKSADVLPRPEYSGSGHILRFALNAEEGG